MAVEDSDKGGERGSSPVSRGGAGTYIEGELGAFYLLSMLADIPAHGLPGARIAKVRFQSPDTIPRDGPATLAPSLDTIGLIARSARDILLTMDATHLVPPSGDIDAERAKPGIAIAVDIMALAEPSVRSACEAGIAHLSELGFSLHDRDAKPEIKRAGDAALRVLQGEAARHFAPSLDALSANPLLRRRLEMGLAVDDATLASDLAGRKAARQEFLTAVFYVVSLLAGLPLSSEGRAHH